MDNKLAETIERYNSEYQKNPNSKVFAPLADAYRKIGELNHALIIAKNGVKAHQNFSGGHIVLGRIYNEMGVVQKAIASFNRATQLDHNNILAHKLLADLYLEDKQVKKALSSYKMVLFLKPSDKTSLERVKKLESLTADEFESESFQLKKLSYKPPTDSKTATSQSDPKLLARALSLSDAYLVRNELEKSFNVLNEAKMNLGEHPEILKRLQLIDRNIESRNTDTNAHSLANRETVYLNENINYLKKLLDQVNSRKKK